MMGGYERRINIMGLLRDWHVDARSGYRLYQVHFHSSEIGDFGLSRELRAVEGEWDRRPG